MRLLEFEKRTYLNAFCVVSRHHQWLGRRCIGQKSRYKFGLGRVFLGRITFNIIAGSERSVRVRGAALGPGLSATFFYPKTLGPMPPTSSIAVSRPQELSQQDERFPQTSRQELLPPEINCRSLG